MFVSEIPRRHRRTKRSCRIKRTTRVSHARQFRNEKRKTDAERSEERNFCLFGGQHQDHEDKEGSEEHFDEDALDFTCCGGEGCLDIVYWTGEHDTDETGCCHGAEELEGDKDYAADVGEATGKTETYRDLYVYQ